MLFPTFLAKKYKTHKGYRTHELTTQVSSCVLYPFLCLIFYKFKLQNIFGQDTNNNKGMGYFGYFFYFHVFFWLFFLFSCFLYVLCYFQHF